MDDRARELHAVTAALRETKTDYALIGGIAVGYHGRQRATVDVDMLVSRRKLTALTNAMELRGYVVKRFPDMIRVYPPGSDPRVDEAIADFVALEANPVLRAAFQETEPAEVLGEQVKIVQRGALVALKFHSATSMTRAHTDKMQDVVDIGRIIEKRFTPPDEAMALRITAHAYPGAQHDLTKLLDDLRHNRPVQI